MKELTTNYINEVMNSSVGTSQYLTRDMNAPLVYTDGVNYVQKALDMYWFVDMVYSHMPAVVKDHKQTEETFYVVKLVVNSEHQATFIITREDYTEEGIEEVQVASQEVQYTDLPECQMKFFLELAQWQPLVYCLLCPSEH